MLTLPYLSRIRTGLNPQDVHDSLLALQNAVNSIAKQSSIDPTGILSAPPTIQALNVTASDGIFTATISDNVQNLRLGVNYFLEYSPSAAFPANNTVQEHLGPARAWHGMLGNQTLFFRAYSQYPNSPFSKPIVFGSVAGGGTATPPAFPNTTGSGTSTASGQGFGPQPQSNVGTVGT